MDKELFVRRLAGTGLLVFVLLGMVMPLRLVAVTQVPSVEYMSFSERGLRSGRAYELVRTIAYDESTRIVVVDGQVGLKLDSCESGYHCLFFSGILISVPEDCSSVQDGAWTYRQYRYDVVDNLDAYNSFSDESLSSARFLVRVSEKRRAVGYFVYSSGRGVHSFVFPSGGKGVGRFAQFHLSSPLGIFRNGCVFPRQGG